MNGCYGALVDALSRTGASDDGQSPRLQCEIVGADWDTSSMWLQSRFIFEEFEEFSRRRQSFKAGMC